MCSCNIFKKFWDHCCIKVAASIMIQVAGRLKLEAGDGLGAEEVMSGPLPHLAAWEWLAACNM